MYDGGNLADGVGGTYRIGCVGAAGCVERRHRELDAGQDIGHREPLTDQSGGTDDHIAGADMQGRGDCFGGVVGVGKAVGTCFRQSKLNISMSYATRYTVTYFAHT